MRQDPEILYSEHVAEMRRRYDVAMDDNACDAIVVAAGTPHPVFMDDQHLPFKANPYLLQWGPLTEHPGSAMIVERNKIPRLLVHSPDDYWHRIPPVPELFAAAGIDIEEFPDTGSIRKRINALPSSSALIGERLADGDVPAIANSNPPDLIATLNEQRTLKTPWEINNMEAASAIGVRGHLAARDCFLGGGSEYEIQLAFRAACGATDTEMPYAAIVALNEHAATLHYQRLDRERCRNLSLLIDAGHAVNGYASDITRTHSDDAEFGALIEAMHELQRNLCEAARPGVDYRDLHHAAHSAITALLCEMGVITTDFETAVETELSRAFFPHGLGHFLGLQVHDVGALYTRRQPHEKVPAGEDKHLRLTRVLEPGNVITIEPGIYFIDSLLATLRAGPEEGYIDWDYVERLRPFGGIRIEDNLHVTAHGNVNLTRQAFAGTM